MDLQICQESRRTLREMIERTVQSRTSGMIRGLRVEVHDEDVVLTGRTSTYYTKQLATHAALDAAADVSLVNSIEVC